MLQNTIAKLRELYPGLHFSHTDCGNDYRLFFAHTHQGIICFFTNGDQVIATEEFAQVIFNPGYNEQNETSYELDGHVAAAEWPYTGEAATNLANSFDIH